MAISSKMRPCGESVHYLKKLKSQMESTVNGDYQYKLEHEIGKRKLIVHTDRIDDEKLEMVVSTINDASLRNIKMVQYNHDISIPWKEIPEGFTVVEYLEINTKLTKAFIKTQVIPNNETGMLVDVHDNKDSDDTFAGGTNVGAFYAPFRHCDHGSWGYAWNVWKRIWGYNGGTGTVRYLAKLNWLNDKKSSMESSKSSGIFDLTEPLQTITGEIYLFAVNNRYNSFNGKLYTAKLSQDEKIIRDFIPCLDTTGTPCLVDRITRTPFYNSGSGDFLYPGKEEEPAVFSLRQPVTYAKLSENGLRRLYHVPVNYEGTKEEYATKFGFKPIVEIECPEEGTYIPQWKENENEIILEWIEIENPEELPNE